MSLTVHPVPVFCVPGGHPPDDGATGLPPGWQLVPAAVIDGIWHNSNDSSTKIHVCPAHLPLPTYTRPEPLPDLVFCGQQSSRGGAGTIEVYDILGQPLDPFKHWPKHSPTGVAWGFTGSGAADCARSLIAAAVGDQRAICPVCKGANKILVVPGDEGQPRQAMAHDPAEHVHDCDYCEVGLLIYPSEYQRFKEDVVAGWPDTFVVTRKGIVGWLEANFPDGNWPDIT